MATSIVDRLVNALAGSRPASSRRRGRRLGISLRALIVAVLVCGGGLGWVAWRARLQREAVAAIKRAGGSVVYDWDWADGRRSGAKQRRPWPKWLVDAVGPDLLGSVLAVYLGRVRDAPVPPELMRQVGRLGRLEALSLYDQLDLSDDLLLPVAGLRRLKELNLMGCQSVTGVGLAAIAGLPRIETLDLMACTSLDDAGLASIGRMDSLRDLNLGQCPGVTDAGLQTLAGMTSLRWLDIQGTRVTPGGVAALRSRLPMARVFGPRSFPSDTDP